MAPHHRQCIHFTRARYYSHMNPDDYNLKKRDWIRDAYETYDLLSDIVTYCEKRLDHDSAYISWLEKARSPHEPLAPARFSAGDLLNAGGIVALVISVANDMNGWRYNVMRDGELMRVDEVALGEWRAI